MKIFQRLTTSNSNSYDFKYRVKAKGEDEQQGISPNEDVLRKIGLTFMEAIFFPAAPSSTSMTSILSTLEIASTTKVMTQLPNMIVGVAFFIECNESFDDSAYVFVGGIPFDLTEGDLLAVFAQYGEIVDVNLVRDKGTGKSKGFAFVAYEDQRSTNLAVDNLNGAQILGRIIRVDHVTKYKKKEEEDDEKEQKMREERGVCRAFQKGECNRGAACRFSHDEQRCANTGWGSKDSESKWDHDKYNGPSKIHRRSKDISEDRLPEFVVQDKGSKFRLEDNDGISRLGGDERKRKSEQMRSEMKPRDQDRLAVEKQSEWKEKERRHGEDRNRREMEKRSKHDESKSNPREVHDRRRREEKRSGKHELEPNPKEQDWKRVRQSKYDKE
ncbi:hypothetical protein NE237_010635 [Protea cynaroides]|uniref:Uncharacterized protein n=1 Tax=Protea cynaroides TaxID=273540 RepID=A0A9Q0R1E7_9MAGN|nr:hypothetical protein NE237_010635 [Protea cynaroides]